MGSLAFLTFAILLFLAVLSRIVSSLVPEDGVCNTLVFAPFTDSTGRAAEGNHTVIGFAQMAAAFLAKEHFNTRNSTVVSELADISNCNVTIQISNTSVFDTETPSHRASQKLVARGFDSPCGIVGPASDMPAIELSAVAQAGQYPIVVSRAYDLRLAYDRFSSYTISVYPDLATSGLAVASFLNYTNRTCCVALLYEMTGAGNQRREVLNLLYEESDFGFFSVGFTTDPRNYNDNAIRSPSAAVSQIKESGYRTIVIALEQPVLSFSAVADAIEAYGLNNGDYFYVFWDNAGPVQFWNANSNNSKLTAGSAWLLALEENLLQSDDPFVLSWRDQGQDLADEINAANPISPGQPGYVYAGPNWFQTNDPDFATTFMYDAVIALGLGACNATKDSNGTISGSNHHKSIRELYFGGATGPLSLGNNEGYNQQNTRSLNTSTFVIVNILPEGDWNLTDVAVAGDNITWQSVSEFQYADGTNNAPLPLRDPPSSNYITTGIRIFGLTLMGLTILGAVVSAMWLFFRRRNRIIASSQPIFLYVILLGAVVQVTSIFAISWDEGAGWSKQALSRACMSIPWLMAIGHSLIYGGLFTKLWRIHRVLQFKKRKVKMKWFLWPMVLFFLLSVLILLVWTLTYPLHWVRTEVNDVTGESAGSCSSDNTWEFLGPLLIVNLIPTFLTFVMSYKTRDVDPTLAEGFWIFIMILVQIEAVVVAAPVVVLLREQATGNTRYAVFVILMWVLPASTICFLIFPKLVMYRRSLKPSHNKVLGSKHQNGQAVIPQESARERSLETSQTKGSTPVEDGKQTQSRLRRSESPQLELSVIEE